MNSLIGHLTICMTLWLCIWHTDGGPISGEPYSMADVKIHTVKQQLDNFHPDDSTLWDNRYYKRKSFFKDNGPVFLQLRGEDSLDPMVMVDHAWVSDAEKYGAFMFQLEHRFYGYSFPTEDLCTDNLQYLTIEQALADTANFIQTMNRKYKFTSNNKWIVMGGSYSGSLALWMAEKYPELVYGAISTSSPIHFQVNFVQYLEAISQTIRDYSGECAEAIQESMEYLAQILPLETKQYELFNNLSLCNSAVNVTPLDISFLLYDMAGNFMNPIQYDGVNIIEQYAPIPLADVCNTMTDESIGTPFDRLVDFNTQTLQKNNYKCVDFKFDVQVSQYQEDFLEASTVTTGNRQWLWQQCTQMGFFQTTDGTNIIFGNGFGLDFFSNLCASVFEKDFDFTAQVETTNRNLGGLNPKVNNVLVVQGTGDPWHRAGLRHNITGDNGLEVLLIEGTGHCANMYPPSPSDPPQLTAARSKITSFIGQILTAPSVGIDVSNESNESDDGDSNE